jgi:hypothetical protein
VRRALVRQHIKHFTGKGLDSYLFPLPPVAEQQRIVAKVAELMRLCDALQSQLGTLMSCRSGPAVKHLSGLPDEPVRVTLIITRCYAVGGAGIRMSRRRRIVPGR